MLKTARRDFYPPEYYKIFNLAQNIENSCNILKTNNFSNLVCNGPVTCRKIVITIAERRPPRRLCTSCATQRR